MPYRLTEFHGAPLPLAMPDDDLGTGLVESSLLDSIGGVYDYHGSHTRLPRRHQFTHRGRYVGEVAVRVTSDGSLRVTDSGDLRATAASALHDLQGKTDALKSRIGMRGRLWRERMSDGKRQWKLCRLLQVEHVETVENADVVSEVVSLFETSQVGWRGAAAVSTSVSASDGVPIGMTIPNAGALAVRDGVLTVTGTSGAISQVQATGPGIDLTWTGSLGVGDVLTVDCGRQTVQVGGADAYSGFVLGVNHAGNAWLPLLPGDNALAVTVVGGDADVSVEHFDQWP